MYWRGQAVFSELIVCEGYAFTEKVNPCTERFGKIAKGVMGVHLGF